MADAAVQAADAEARPRAAHGEIGHVERLSLIIGIGAAKA
jgi:hypothetical protein